MKIKSFLIKKFTDPEPTKGSIVVPTGAIFRRAKILHDGIYAYYEVTELTLTSTREDHYILLTSSAIIPENAEFVDILDVVLELDLEDGEIETKQAVQIIPIYKLNT